MIFTIAVHFPHRENTRLDTLHTQRDNCDDERRFRPPGHNPSTFQSSALYATSEASYFLTDLRLYSSSASCKRWYGYRFGSRSHHKDQFLRQCHLVTQASPEFKNVCQTTALSAAFTSRRRLRQIKVKLSLSLHNIRYSSLYYWIPSVDPTLYSIYSSRS